MNLVREYLVTVAGAHIYAIISMLLFLVVFILMIYYTYSIRKEDIGHFSKLPLEDDEHDQN
jgi:TRAP-type C4-dicarboxylate transport system permease small subunit